MSDRFPIDERARERLREAQRLESDALKAIGVAARAHQAAVARTEQTQTDLDSAYAALVKVSGEARAARLTGVAVKSLRRGARNVGSRRTQSE